MLEEQRYIKNNSNSNVQLASLYCSGTQHPANLRFHRGTPQRGPGDNIINISSKQVVNKLDIYLDMKHR